MGLVANCFRNYVGNLAEGSAHACLPGQFDAYRQFEKFIMPDMASAVLQGAADPPGYYLGAVYQPPIRVGEMSMWIEGEGGLEGDLIPSYPMSIDMTGSGDLAATAALVVAMSIAMTGSGDLAATILGRLNASLDLTGSGDLSASMTGIANLGLDLTGSGDLDATIAAYGNMAIDIVVTGTGLSTANVGPAVWSALAAANNVPGTMGEKLNDAGSASNPWTEVLEGGYTAGDLQRLMAAALLGELSGAPGGPIEIKGVDGSTVRITATVDSSGNRLAVILDVSP